MVYDPNLEYDPEDWGVLLEPLRDTSAHAVLG